MKTQGHLHILVATDMGVRILVWSTEPTIDWAAILESQLPSKKM